MTSDSTALKNDIAATERRASPSLLKKATVAAFWLFFIKGCLWLISIGVAIVLSMS